MIFECLKQVTGDHLVSTRNKEIYKLNLSLAESEIMALRAVIQRVRVDFGHPMREGFIKLDDALQQLGIDPIDNIDGKLEITNP